MHVIDDGPQPGGPQTLSLATTLARTPSATSGLHRAISFLAFEAETSVYSELTQTTSFVAAGLVTAKPTATTSTGVASNGTTSAPVVEQTANAGGRMELPVLAAVAVGAVAFAVQM